MRFATPEALLLFVPLLLVALYAWRVGVRRRARLFHPSGTWIDQRPRFTLPSPFKVHFWLRLVALAFFVVALARPQKVFQNTTRIVEAVDIVICFDLSRSMDALDFKPNRRVVALNTISNFIDKRIDDRIGLVLFSGEAFLAVPPTSDHDMLRKSLFASSNKYLQDGTAIGQAIATAAHHLRNSTAKSRVIILVTDGDNNMGAVDPITAAELAKAYNLKVYTIAIGKKGRVAYPVKMIDAFGRETEVMDHLDDAINEDLLNDIATRTGAQFFRAGEENVLNKVFDTINALEKTKVQTNTFVRYGELAWPWIFAGVALLLIEGLALNTRWRKIP